MPELTRDQIQSALLAVLPQSEWDYDRERLLFEATEAVVHLIQTVERA